jgi:RNase P/RNase MRP subunit POP5
VRISEFERPLESWSPVLAKSVLLDAVRTLHGQLGAGLWEPQLLHFDPASREAIVAVPAR